MPNYRGLDVLQYECDILKSQNEYDEFQIALFKDAPYLSQSDKDQMVALYQSSIEERNVKIGTFLNLISDYLKDNDTKSTHISYDPLEYIYQEFLQRNLPRILKRIEQFYKNYCDKLLSDSIAYFSFPAKKIASHSLHDHAVGYIVQVYLLTEKNKELESPYVVTEKAKSAIRSKYEYFSDRIDCCLEIGNKIRELSR